MGILKSLHEPCHLKIQDGRLASLVPPPLPSSSFSTQKKNNKRVSFNGNVRVQILEKYNSSGGSSSEDDDAWYLSTTDTSIPSRRATMPKKSRRTRRRKAKIPVQRVLVQQAKELRSTGCVNPYALADASAMISSIFAEEAHLAALNCAVEVDEYLHESDSSSESEASDFEDILL